MFEFLNKYRVVDIVFGTAMAVSFYNRTYSLEDAFRNWSIISGVFLVLYIGQLISKQLKEELSLGITVIVACIYVVLFKTFPVILHIIGAASLLIIYLLMRADYKCKWLMLFTMVGIAIVTVVKFGL